MATAKLILDWIAAIAWPALIAALVIAYKEDVSRVLASIAAFVERINKDAEQVEVGEALKVTFRAKIEKAEEEARGLLPLGTPGVDLPWPEGQTPPPAAMQNAPLPPNYSPNLLAVAEISPRAAIVEAWRNVEIGLRILAEKRNLPTAKSLTVAPVSSITKLLSQHEVIDGPTMNVLEELRQLRNQVVHQTQFDPSPKDAQEFVRLAQLVAVRLRTD